jgi:hypothetical protein
MISAKGWLGSADWTKVAGVAADPAFSATGNPQFGQDTATLETCRLHSGQMISAMA